MGKARDLADLVNKQSSDYFSLLTKNGKEARIRIATDIATEAVLTLNQAGALTVKENGVDTLYTIPDLIIANIKPPSNFEAYGKNNLPTTYKATGHRYFAIVDDTTNKHLIDIAFISNTVTDAKIYNVVNNSLNLSNLTFINKGMTAIGVNNRLKSFSDVIVIESDTDKTILQDKMKIEDIRLFDIEGIVIAGFDKFTLPKGVYSFQYYKGQGVEGFFYTTEMRTSQYGDIYFYNMDTKTNTNLGYADFEPTYTSSDKYLSFTVDGDRLVIPTDGKLHFYNITVLSNGTLAVLDINTFSKEVVLGGGTYTLKNNLMISSGKDKDGYWTMFEESSTSSAFSYKANETGAVKDFTKISDKTSTKWVAGLSLVDKGDGKVLGNFEVQPHGFLQYTDMKLTNRTVKGFTKTNTDGKVHSRNTFISNHPDPDKIWISARGRSSIYLVQTKDNWASATYVTIGDKNVPLKTRQQFFKDNGFTD